MQFRADDNPDQASSPVSGETGHADGFVVAKGGVEARLAALWAALFKRKRVGRFDDFFELGGDSLLAAQLLARIQEAFSVEVAIDRLFVHRNVAALAGFIETIGKVGDAGQGAGATLLASSSVKTLSYSQQRLWFLAQLEGPNPTYNIARVVRLDGTPDIDIFRIALQALVDRHEALRTTFAVHDGKPTLQIHDQQVLLAVEDAADVARWEELCARESGHCFDLNGDCLYRLTLVKRSFVTSGNPYCLLATFHHSVFDGLSVSIFIRDLGALYGALSRNAQADLPQLPLQFSDYAAWQQKRLHNGEFKEYESYWRQQLAELPPCIDLPSDRPRPAERSHRGAAAEIRIGGLAASRLKDLARQHNATMYMVLLSAFAVLLGRYTNQNDIAIGSPVANRPHRDLENVIGFFVNTLVMRCRPSDQKTFVELIGETREVVLMALANQDIPFDLLVETIRPARSLNTTPLFQVMFALLNEDGLQGQGGGWAELEEPGRAQAQDSAGNGGEGVAHFDMTLLVKMLPEGLQCKLEYATDMFDAETVQGVLSSFKSLVESLGEQSSVPLSVFACVSEKDFQRQVQAWNQTTSSFDIDSCIHELFERRVDACPDAIALVFENQSISFHELNNRANWLARHLLDGGLELESHVGLFFERAIDMVVAILAVVKAGACYVPLDPWLPAERTQFILKDADVKWVLSNVALPDFMRSDTLRNVNVPQVLEQGGYDPLSRYPNIARNSIGLCPDNLVYWLYTSGTSGQPKGVMIRHSSLSNLCQDSILRRGFNGECRNLQFAPITFDAASAEIFNSLLSGSILHIPKVNVLTSAEEFSAYSKKHAINRGYIPPAFLPTLDSRDFSAYRSLSVGGEAIPKEIARQWSGVCKLTNAYGPTECTIACTSGTVDGLEDVSIGSFVANVNGYVMNDALQLVPVGVVGELCIGGECLARGYANDRRLTAEKFIPDPFSRQAGARLYRSGDLVRYRKDGKLEFVGRKDQQVKLRGFRIELGEIESCLMHYPGIKAAVASVQGNEENRKLVAHYLMHDDAAEEIAQEIDSHGLRAFAQQRLPAYMVPAGFARLAAFPLTANGKVDRKSLPAVKLESADGAGMLPIGEAEWRMAQLWSQLLQVEAVGRFDNFFELGGHSLLAAHLVSRVREAFGADVSVRDLFENQTLDRFTALVDAHQGDEGLVLPVLQICPRGESPLQLSPAQKRLWFLYKFMGKNAVFNIPLVLQLKGKLDKEKLQAAVTKIIHRHEALRTRFVERDGDVLQMIDPPAPFVLLEETAHGEEELHALCHRESSTHFDLCSDALFRFCLIKLLDKDGRDGTGDAAVHVVHVTLHHILADGQSAAVLLQELAHFYNEGYGTAPLPPLPFQYGDYVAWQGDPGRTAQIEQQIDYWRNKLSGLPSSLELPFDFARPREQTFAGATRNVVIAPDISRQLRELGRQNGATFFMTLIAAFGVLLGRYSGQTDFAVGTPISKREVPGSDRLIGLFLNLLVLRFNVDLGRSFTSLLQAAKDTAIDAYRHQDVPFESLVESLKPERSLGHTPFFQTSFTLVENPLEGIAFQDLDFSVLNIEEERGGVARYDLTFTLRVLPDGSVMCNMEYNTDLFLAQTIERMLTHFLRLLEAVVADPDCAVGRLTMLDETEQHRMLVEWNGTAQDYAGERTVHQLFEAQAAKTPDSAALVFEDQALTYAEVNARANRLAHHLRGQGVGPDVLVGLCMERAPDMIVGLLGILKAGGAYVPLDPAYPQDRLAYMLEDAQPALLLTQARYRDTLPDNVATFCLDSQWQELETNDTNPENRTQAGNLAYVIYTSGSTGKPKGVLGSVGGLRNRLMWMQASFPYGAGTNYLQKTSISFIDSLTETLGPLLFGGCLHIAGSAIAGDPQRLGQLIEREQIARLVLVPSLLKSMVQSEEGGIKSRITPGLDMIVCSGEALPSSLTQLCRDTSILNLYGSSEGTGDSTWHLCDGTSSDRDMIPIGRPIANTEIYLLDSAHNPVPVGVAGELHIAGAGLARGYLNRAGLTAEKFVPNPYGKTAGARMYKTGDLARYLPDGSIDYLGRIDNQVKVRGFRIELGEIESALRAAEQVAEAVVVAREDEPGDKRLVAYVVPASLDVSQLRQALQQHLPDYMVPAYFVTQDALPLTPNGKVDRKALPAPEARRNEGGYVAPRTPVEEILAGIWAEVLKLDKVGVEDNFFELGGHSLLAVKVIERMRLSALHADVRTLFSAPSVAALAVATGQGSNEVKVPPNGIVAPCEAITPDMLPLVRLSEADIAQIVSGVPGGAGNIQDIYPLAPLQEGILYHHLMSQAGDAYLLSILFGFDTRARLDGFIAALQAVVDRHDILRTAIQWEGLPEPVQVVWRHAPVVIEGIDLDAPADAVQQLKALHDRRHYRLDVRDAPMTRGFVAEDKANGRWLLKLLVHHLVCDRATLEILIAEIRTIGQAQHAQLPHAAPYRNYIAQAKLGIAQADHEAFFSGMLRDIDEPTAPFGLLDVQGDGSGISESRRMVDAALAARARRQSRRLGVSAASLMHLAWAQVLSRLSGRQSVVFGTVLLGRLQGGAGADRVMGMFINTLPVRIDVDGAGVEQGVRQVHAMLTQLLHHEHASLALAQRCSGVASPMPLFSSLFNYRHSAGKAAAPSAGGEPDGWEMLAAEERTNYPLAMSVDDLGDGFSFKAQIVAAIQAERLCNYMHAALENLVSALEQAPWKVVNRIDVLPAAERRLLSAGLGKRPGTGLAGTARTLTEALAEKSRSHGAAIALRQGEAERSYSELEEQTNQMAHYLRAQGLQRHDVAAVRLRPSIECVTVLLGLLKLGCSYVLIDSTKSLQRQSWMVKNAGAGVRIDGADTASPLPGISTEIKVITFDGYAHHGQPIEAPTSRLQVEEGDIAVLCFGNGEQNYAHGFSHAGVLQCALAGAQGATPNLEQIGGLDSYSLALWSALLAGNAVDPSDLPVADSVTAPQHIPAQEQTCEFYVLAGSDIVPIGTWGELCIGGAAAAQIVRAAPGHAAALLLPHPFSERPGERLYATGLRARYHSNGDLDIEPYGVIPGASPAKSRALEQTERALRQQPGLEDVALERESSFGGPGKIVAYCVLTEGVEVEAASASLLTALRRRLPFGLLPSAIVRVAHIPRHANGTADFTQLASPYQREGQEDHEWPVGPCEELLAGIWTDLLQCGRVSRHANFFELGGYSLIGMQLVARIRNVFGIELPLRDVFERKDLQSQALLIQQAQQQGKPLAVLQRVDRTAALPLSFSQQRLWFLSRMMPPNAVYNISVGLRLRGKLDEAALVKALATVVARHEALRTRFGETDGQAVQIIDPVPPASTCVTLADVESEEALRNYCLNERGHCFDLGSEPLYRLHLLHLLHMDHDGQRVLHATFHHIVFDGWSVGVFFKEVVQHYRATLAGLALPPAPAIQYADYAHWQREQLTGEVIASQLQYWETQLSGLPPLLELPTDRPRPAEQSYRGATAHIELDQALVEGLASLCRAGGSTLFMSLISVFAVLLARYAGQDDIAIGTPVANRGHSETEELIGFFLNSLVLRFDLSGKRSFKQLLGSTREMALQAYAHQDIPFEHLVEHLNPARSLSHAPLFQVSCSLVNTPVGGQMLSGIDVEPLQFAQEEGVARFDLSFTLRTLQNGGLAAGMEYNTDLFDAPTIARMLGHYRCLLEAVVLDPDCPVQDLSMLPQAERQQLLVEWNETARAYPREQAIHQLFEEQAGKTSDNVALVFGDETLSYGELNARANRLAHYLRSQGVGPDVLVGICVERSLDMIVGLLAILKAGGAYVPLDPAYPQARLATMLDDAKPAVLLTQEHLRGTLPSDVPRFCLDSQWQELEANGSNPDNLTQAGNLAYVIFTSGSTGRPKGVVVTHQAVNRLVKGSNYFSLDTTSRVLQFSSIAFDASTFEIWGALLNGASLVIAPPGLLSLEQLGLVIKANRVDTLWLTSTLFSQMVEHQLPSLMKVGHVLAGGEVLSTTHVERFVKTCTQAVLTNGYGPTENTTFTCCHAVPADADFSLSIPIGSAISNTRVYILDRCLNPVPTGVAGELHIAGDGLARGYLNRPDLTAEKFIANPFGAAGSRMYKSGDLARYLVDGKIEYLGRIDNQVKIRGFRIELGEIEAALTALEQVREALVLAREDEPGDKRLVAYVVAAGQERLDVAQLRLALQQSLPEYMIPSHFVALEKFPLTTNGKVDRKALPVPDMARSELGYVAPRSATEEILAGIWADVLKLDKVGIHDNFFELGGHSLLAVKVIERMRQSALQADVRTLFATPTVAALAVATEQGSHDITVPPNGIMAGCADITPAMLPLVQLNQAEIARIISGVPGGAANIQDIYPLAPLQEGILFHHMINEQGDPYLLPILLGFDTRARLDSFVAALQTVIDRHDILRTAVQWEGLPEPVQVVWRHAPIQIEELQLDPANGDVASQLSALHDPRHYRMDVRQAPMKRCFIAQDRAPDQAQGRWVLQILTHHLVSDHTGLEIQIQEIQAILQGQQAQLPAALPYRNYIAQARLGIAPAEHESFFGDMLGDIDEPTAPFGLLDVQGDGSGVDEARRLVDTGLALRARQQSRRLGVSAASLMHLAWAQVLSRLSGRQNVVFGTVLLGRLQGGAGADRVMGMFINTLPVCIDVDGAGVEQGVRQVHALLTQLLRHEHASLALAQRCSGVAAPMPLFSALFNYRHSAVESQEQNTQAAWEGMSIVGTEERTNYPVGLSVDDLGDGFAFKAQIVATHQAKKLCDYMHTALDNLVLALEQTPHQALNSIDILPQAERQQLLIDWNQTEQVWPGEATTIHQRIAQQAAKTPDSVAVVFEGTQLRYAELNARANRLAHYLRAQGVGPDVLVGICVERSLDMIVGLLGILKAGGAYVPLDPAYPAERLAYMLDDAQPALLLTQERLLSSLPENDIASFCLDSQWQELPANEADPADVAQGGNLAYVIYTSGSTGKPKGIGIRQRSAGVFIEWAKSIFDEESLCRVLASTSMCFDLSIFEMFVPLCCGGSVWVVRNILDLAYQPAASFPITMINTVPSAITELHRTGAIPKSVKVINLAGEALPNALVQALYLGGCAGKVFNLYGPSEDTTYSTFSLTRQGTDELVTIGRPVANTQTYVLDGGLNPVPVGVAGELYIAGDGLARGYLNRPDLTAEKFIANPFGAAGSRMYKSGDLARYLVDGKIEYLGRIDNQVKIRGFRIELGEIEAALTALEQVREALVLAREDEPGDKRLVAYVVAAGQERLDVAQLRLALQQSLPEYMIPSHFVALEKFPLTTNGKVDRKALPVPDMARSELGYVAPRSATEEILAGIWADVLKLDKVGIHDNFFELGGHSLLAVKVIERMRQSALQADVRTLFATPTVAALAVATEEGSHDITVPPNGIMAGCADITPAMLPLVQLNQAEIARIVSGVPGGAANIQDIYPLAPLQEGILFHHLMNEQGDAYLRPLMIGFDTRARLDSFVSALQTVIDRHDILRTAVQWEGLPEPVQVVWRHASVMVEEVSFDVQEGEVARQLSAQHDPAHYRLDVRRAPMMRGFVAQDPDHDRWLLQLLMHHLVDDATSLKLLVNEIQTILRGQQAQLPAALPYRNFVAQSRLGITQAEHEAFFTDMLASVDEPTAPFGLIDVQGNGSDMKESRRPVDAELARRTRQQARRLGVSVASLMHLAWALVLSRISERRSVVFGTVLLGRLQGGAGADRVMGLFINTLPICIDVDGAGVEHGVREVHATLTQLLRHEHASLALAQHCSGVAAPMPLFSALLNYRHSAKENVAAAGTASAWTGMELLGGGESTNYPVNLSVDDLGDGFDLTAQVIATVEARRICDYMHTAIENLVLALEQAPGRAANSIDVLPMAERLQLLVEWNDSTRPYPDQQTIHQLFEEQAAKTPDSVAVAFEGRQLSYTQLNARANRLAHYLRTQGVGPDVLVAICAERSLEMIVGLLGILKAGGAYVPLDPGYPSERLAYMLDDAKPLVLLTQERLIDALPANGIATFCLDSQWDALENIEANSGSQATAANLAYVIYTSGSTGRPKGVVVTHQAVNRLVFDTEYVKLQASDKVAQAANSSFDAITFEIWGALLHGCQLHIVSYETLLSPLEFAEEIRQKQIDTLFITTALFNQIAHHAPDAFGHVDYLLFGGEAVDPRSVVTVLERGAPQNLLHVYGPTESTTFALWHGVAKVSDDAVTIPIGRPIANTQIYLLDSALNPVPLGAAGELHIGGAGLARGYLNRPDLTAEKFIANPFGAAGERMYRSGDLARYLPDGSIEYLGRIDNQVKVRGFRIEPGEIEAALTGLAEVRETLVVALEDESGSKRLVAYVVPAFQEVLEAAQLRLALQQRLPDYMIPSHFMLLERFPLTPNGKVDRKALPAPEAIRSEIGYMAPRTPTEEILAGMWAALLKLDKAGVEDNFFDLGGHSLLATQLISKIRVVFDMEVPLRALFEAPTIALLARRLERIRQEQAALVDSAVAPATAPAIMPVERGGNLPLSFAQQRLWFLDQFDPGQPSYNMPTAFRVKGKLDIGALTDTFNEIVRRHETLRTIFTVIEGMPVQVIVPALTLAIPCTDLSELLPAEREAQAQWLAQDEAQTPFDLSEGPLIRCQLLVLAEDEHVLLFTIHHIVSDGWSMSVLLGELASLYTAYVNGQESPLTALPIQYADYASWQRQWLSGDVLEQQLRYWQGQLAGAPTLLSLPTDRPRPVLQSHRGATKGFRIDAQSTAGLHGLCKQTQSTLFMSLAAVFNVMLCRYAQQCDICIGTAIANRNRAEVEGLIGFFVNTLVLRTQVNGGERFSDLLKRVRSTALEAYAHQDVPFEQLVEAVKPERHTSHSPLFQVMLILQNTPADVLTLPDVNLQPFMAGGATSKFDLTLYVTERNRELLCTLEYNTDLFDGSTIERMAGHFTALLQAAVADPEMAVRDLTMLQQAEREELLVGWNRTAQAWPRGESAQQLFEAQAARTPGSVALVFEEQALTYAELNARANRLAHHLRGQGVGPDVLVGLCVERSLDMVVGLLGVMKAGGAYIPLDPAYPQDRLAYMLEDAKPAVLLTQEKLAATFGGSFSTFRLDSQWQELAVHDANPEHVTQPDNLAYVIYTSGSTGKPKGVGVYQRGLVNFLHSMAQQPGIEAEDRLLCVTSLSFDIAGLEIFLPLISGARTVIVSRETALDPQRLAETIEAQQITLMQATPSTWRLLVNHGWPSLPHKLKVLCGGEALPLELMQQLLEHVPAIWNLYGPTESTIWSSAHCIDNGERNPVIGRPIANTSIYLLDEALNPVPVGVAGELYIAGAGLARGYLNRAGLTAEKFLPDPYSREPGARMYRAGDLARYLPNGEIDYLGRVDNQVKIRGFRIEPGEIEAALTGIAEVGQALVVAREDEPGDKRLVAYVTAAGAAGELDAASLRQVLQQSLPEYMVPSHIMILEQMPLTPNGKLDRKALPAPEATRSEMGYVAPRTATEEMLADIWAEVLKLDRVGIHDNFFELGGHSLLATQVVSSVRITMRVDLPLRALFEAPTIASLSLRIACEGGADHEEPASEVMGEVPEGFTRVSL